MNASYAMDLDDLRAESRPNRNPAIPLQKVSSHRRGLSWPSHAEAGCAACPEAAPALLLSWQPMSGWSSTQQGTFLAFTAAVSAAQIPIREWSVISKHCVVRYAQLRCATCSWCSPAALPPACQHLVVCSKIGKHVSTQVCLRLCGRSGAAC